jgi:hypothetical protein
MRLRFNFALLSLPASALLCACFGSNNAATTPNSPPPVLNTMAVMVDSGPAAATGQINHAYVTVKVCSPGSQAQCAYIDHVLLDTGSWGLRLVGSVLAGNSIVLSAERDAQNQTIEECVTFGGGQTWGAVALADISMAGEVAAGVPVQVMDDSAAGTPPPATCGANGTLINDVAGFGANGVLGIGVFAQDCGMACVAAATPLPIYFGCTGAGTCTAENVALSAQVTNPVAMFAADNNGVIINLPNPQNANGDATLSGEMTFGIATQADNALPLTGLTLLAADAKGEFTAAYNGSTTALPALLDSANDSYAFDDPSIAVCATGDFIGYYCPVISPQSLFAVNTGAGANGAVNTVQFAIADPSAFVTGASAFINLGGGGGSTGFTWGMPFFYGRKVFIAIDQRSGGGFTGPYYAY